MKAWLSVIALLFTLFGPAQANAQYFGKNKVNYTPFDWQYFSTKNFDIYFTEGGYETALIASKFAEAQYERLSLHWDYQPRKRIPLMVYNSHNDFTQTNVIMDTISEGTGGFTELFKNRVVIPWEGSLSKFKHVIDHELTHAMYFDMLYGGLIESIVGREYLFQLPLWFAEGLAEHESNYWSTEADMIARDGIISGYLPPIERIYGGYLVYKGGESFFKFLQEEYGSNNKWVAGELLNSLRTTKDISKSYNAVFGKKLEDLSKDWHRKLKAEHWPEVAGRELPDDFGTKLTDHQKEMNYINSFPAFNPTGDKIAFLTDRNGYKEIMIMRAADGKILNTVVKGEKAGDYEEMHWLRGGITWSPDGTMLAYATKAGDYDAIHISKVENKGYNKLIKPKMDAIYSPSWSPDGSRIMFSAIHEGKLDLFTVDVETEEIIRLTNDFFDEATARWSPDGSQIVYSSDCLQEPYEITVDSARRGYDIFIMNADASGVRRITTSPFQDTNPSWSPDGKNIVFISDRNGISNLYAVNLDEMTVKPLTNLLTSASSPTWSPDGDRIAFTSFKDGGWDIYIVKRPLKRDIGLENMSPTKYRTETLNGLASAEADSAEVVLADNGTGQQITVEHVPPQKYKIKFTPDMFNAFASYNTFYGLGGMGQLSLSDIMGNHRINIAGNLFYNLEESNMFLSYYYLKQQINWGIHAFHYKTYYRSSNWDIFSDRIYGGALVASRPFNKFKRLDLSVNVLELKRQAFYTTNYYNPYYSNYRFSKPEDLDGVSSLSIETELVHDNTLWSYTGPAAGTRYRLNIEHIPDVGFSDVKYTTVEGDFRKYVLIAKKFNIVTRFSGGASMGDDPRMFFLGGTNNWLNARISSIPSVVENSSELYFSRFAFPLRGLKYYELYGRRYFLSNFEVRFPFIDYLALGWPLPLVLGNIQGAVFTDIGSAWGKRVIVEDENGDDIVVYDDSFHGGGKTSNGDFAFDDIMMTWGVGLRMNLGFAVLRLDTAWRVLREPDDPKPMFSVAIGPDF